MKGKIQKINQYKSGKGCFIGIGGTDYMFFGNPDAKVGDEVEYELGKINSMGKPTIKSIHSCAIEAFIDEDKPRSAPIPKKDERENYWAGKEQREIAKEPQETRIKCLTIAGMVFEGAQKGHDEEVIALARKFEKYAKSGE